MSVMMWGCLLVTHEDLRPELICVSVSDERGSVLLPRGEGNELEEKGGEGYQNSGNAICPRDEE